MCSTLTAALIFGCLETISYLVLTMYFVLSLSDLRSKVDWDLHNEIDIYEINKSGNDQETIYMVGILLGSIGLLCSVLLVIGLIKRCQLLLLPWFSWDTAILVANTIYAVYTKNGLHLAYSVLWFITLCVMVSLHAIAVSDVGKLENKLEAPRMAFIANPYKKSTNIV